MTRKPRSRLPQKLERAAPVATGDRGGAPSVTERLKDAHVTGRSARFTRDDVMTLARHLVKGAREPRLGLPPFEHVTSAHAELVLEQVYGWDGTGARARIAPARTLEAFTAACARVAEVARAGGRVAFATTRPASLVPLHRELAGAVDAAGGEVLTATESGPVGTRGRRLWWLDRVAVMTDGVDLVGTGADEEMAEELFFALARPDLVVADGVFAGVGLRIGHEVVAFAGLGALALAVAGWQGRAVRVVPLDEQRPPTAYAPLVELVPRLVEQATGRRDAGAGPDDETQAPLATFATPGA